MRFLRLTALMGFTLALFGPAVAQADSLYVGTPYNTIYMNYTGGTFGTAFTNSAEGGGNIQNSKLNGMPLDYLYCVDLFTTIPVPATYANTVVKANGVINNVTVTNAAQVEWLMDNYADNGLNGTETIGSQTVTDIESQRALQAAIWAVVHTGVTLGTNNTAGTIAAYNAYMAALPVAGDPTYTASNWYWFTPKNATSNRYQGLIGGPYSGGSSVVPEAGSLMLLLPGLAPLALALRKRARRA